MYSAADNQTPRLASNAALRRRFQALNEQPKELPLSTTSWFVASGMSLTASAVVGGLHMGSGLSTVIATSGLIALAGVSFVCGSLSWPGSDQDWKEDAEVCWQTVRSSLNCALGLVLSGASIMSTVIFALLAWQNAIGLMGMQALSALLCVVGYGIASSVWASQVENIIQDAPPALGLVPMLPPAAVDPDVAGQVDELIASLQRAVQPVRPVSSPARTLQALRAAATPVSLQTPIPTKPAARSPRLQPVQLVSIECYVKDDSAIGEVLEMAVGSAERLIG